MSADTVTLLAALDGKILTKRVRHNLDIEDYDHAYEFAVTERPVANLIDLGRLLATLEPWPTCCIIRGRPLPGINRERSRRLKDADPKDDTPPSFEPAARRWIGIDVDSLTTPIWDPAQMERRRVAIERDRAEHGMPLPKGEDDGEDYDPAGDEDPAPIDPVKDSPLAVRAAVSTLPPEFHGASAWWQMTSGAGIKPGIRMRLWYWLDRPVSDAEAKRWLEASPVDGSIYGAVAIHYTASPIFDDPADDPVPIRSGFFWRHHNTVAVPELPEPTPEPRPATTYRGGDFANSQDRAKRYAAACIDSVVAAPTGTGKGRTNLIAVARKLYSMANAGLLDHAQVTAELHAAMQARGWTGTGKNFSADEVERHLQWAKGHADNTLPEGFR